MRPHQCCIGSCLIRHPHRVLPSRHPRDGQLACGRCCRVFPRIAGLVAGAAAMIRIEAAWLATAPLDMRAGTDTALARVVNVFGAAHPHHAYLFANKRANRIKVLASASGWRLAACTGASSSGRNQAMNSGSWSPISSRPWSWVCPGSAWKASASSLRSEAGVQSVDLRITAQCHPGHTACHVDAAAIPG